MRKLKMTLLCSLFLITTAYAQKQFTLTSPNGHISTTINIGEKSPMTLHMMDNLSCPPPPFH